MILTVAAMDDRGAEAVKDMAAGCVTRGKSLPWRAGHSGAARVTCPAVQGWQVKEHLRQRLTTFLTCPADDPDTYYSSAIINEGSQ